MPFYDFFANQQFTAVGKRWMNQAAGHILAIASKSVREVGSVVEIGPGWGALARVCGERSVRYVAIDANLTLLQSLGDLHAVCSVVPPIPLGNESCDVIVASHVLEHSNGRLEAQQLILEMKRVVRPRGCVIIVSPDLLWAGKYFWDCDYSHSFPTSARRLQQMLVDARLTIVKVEYIYNHLTGWRGFLAGQLTSLIPYRLYGCQPHSLGYSEKLYRLRMTFSRSVVIVGVRVE